MIPIRHYATIDSTNLEAHRLFAAGECGPIFILADEQTAGKGRLNRNWVSARGNCYCTMILPLKAELAAIPQIGFVVALAVAEVAKQNISTPVKLKWPNDVLVGGAKVAGILCEVLSSSPLVVAIGCGINVAHAPTGLPYPATCLVTEGASTTRDVVFKSYSTAISYWLTMWENGQNFNAIRRAWIDQAIGIGEAVTMRNGDHHLTGRFEGLTEHGALLLKPEHGPPHTLYSGDLHIPSLAALRNGTK